MTRAQTQHITKLLADPTRFAILEHIAQCKNEMPCANLLEQVRVTPATLSHHLKELADAGLISTRRQAKFMHLKLNRDTWRDYLARLRKLI